MVHFGYSSSVFRHSRGRHELHPVSTRSTKVNHRLHYETKKEDESLWQAQTASGRSERSIYAHKHKSTHHGNSDDLNALRHVGPTFKRSGRQDVIPQTKNVLHAEFAPEQQSRPLHPVKLPVGKGMTRKKKRRQRVSAATQTGPTIDCRTLIPRSLFVDYILAQ